MVKDIISDVSSTASFDFIFIIQTNIYILVGISQADRAGLGEALKCENLEQNVFSTKHARTSLYFLYMTPHSVLPARREPYIYICVCGGGWVGGVHDPRVHIHTHTQTTTDLVRVVCSQDLLRNADAPPPQMHHRRTTPTPTNPHAPPPSPALPKHCLDEKRNWQSGNSSNTT